MNAGLVFSTPVFEMAVSASGSWSTNIGRSPSSQATCTTGYVGESGGFISLLPGCQIEVAQDDSSSTVELTVALLSISGSWSGSAGVLDFLNLKIYSLIGSSVPSWKVTWTGINFYVDGTLEYSSGTSGSLVSSSAVPFCPASIPLFGIPPTLQSISGGGFVLPTECTGTSSVDNVGTQTAVNGWRFQSPGGSWIMPPVDLVQLALPSGTCLYGNPAMPTLSATTTWNASITTNGGEYGVPNASSVLTLYDQTGSICLVPNLTKVVRRLGAYDYYKSAAVIEDYGALIYRGTIPSATSTSQLVCGSTTTNASDTWFGQATDILSHVENPPHPLENPFDYPTRAPYYANGVKNVFYCSCDPCGPLDVPLAYDESATSELLGCNGSTTGSLSNLSLQGTTNNFTAAQLAIIQYINMVASPHWSCVYYYPPDEETDSNAWDLFGGAAPSDSYWIPSRTQYIYNSALPPAELTETRTDNINAVLQDGTLQINLFTDPNTSWWGICRFIPDTVSLYGSVGAAPSSGSGWTVTNATASYGGSDITLTPNTSVTSVNAKYLLEGFTYAPYMAAQIASTFAVNWSGSGIAACAVNLIGIDGTVVTLGNAPGTLPFPKAKFGTEYAGSWAQNYGVGFTSSDTGSDYDVSGISGPVMGSNATSQAFELTGGMNAKYIEFVFAISDYTQPITLDYPSFGSPSGIPGTVYENGFQSAIIFPNGPGVRFGNWSFWNYVTSAWTSTPQNDQFGYKATPLDWLGQKNCMFLGLEPQTGVVAQLASWFDSVEGQTELLASIDTYAVPFTFRNGSFGALISNAYREVPPIAHFPLPARDALTLALDYSNPMIQESWAYDQEPRYLINPVSEAHMITPSGDDWSTPSAYSIPGWSLSSYSHAVTNSEGTTYFVERPVGKKKGVVSPWHGYYSVLPPSVPGLPRAYDVALTFRHCRVTYEMASGDMLFGVAPNGNPYSWSDLDTGIQGDYARTRWQDSGNTPAGILYAYSAGASPHDLLWVQSLNEGNSWGTPMTIATTLAAGGFFDYDETSDFNRWFFWLEGSSSPYTLYMCILDAQNNIILPRSVTNVTNADLASIAVRESIITGGGRRIGLLYSTGGNLTFLTSRDGRNWS